MKKLSQIVMCLIIVILLQTEKIQAQCNCGDKDPVSCRTCYGTGLTDCFHCNGKGSDYCYFCGGYGVRQDADGNDQVCSNCRGFGWVGCTWCGGGVGEPGTGKETCLSCGGRGCWCPTLNSEDGCK